MCGSLSLGNYQRIVNSTNPDATADQIVNEAVTSISIGIDGVSAVGAMADGPLPGIADAAAIGVGKTAKEGLKKAVKQSVKKSKPTVGGAGKKAKDSGKNSRHGDGGRSQTAADKQIAKLQERASNEKGAAKTKTLNKIKKIEKIAAKNKKGTEHSRTKKR